MKRLVDLNPPNTPSENRTSPCWVVEKGWGREEDGIGEIFAYHESIDQDKRTESEMCVGTVKLLHFGKGKKLSRHFHLEKKEIFVVATGAILLELWDRMGEKTEVVMRTDSRVIIPPGCQHRMTGLEDVNVLVEISSLDKTNDSYRIERGD